MAIIAIPLTSRVYDLALLANELYNCGMRLHVTREGVYDEVYRWISIAGGIGLSEGGIISFASVKLLVPKTRRRCIVRLVRCLAA